MKKLSVTVFIFLVFIFTSCATTDQNAKNNLNLAGTYTGVLPGANSDINMEITLNKDGTYKVTYQYIDKSEELFTYTGKFLWKDSSTIDLKKMGMPSLYIVGNNTLTQLDSDGNKIEGRFADMYVLKKK